MNSDITRAWFRLWSRILLAILVFLPVINAQALVEHPENKILKFAAVGHILGFEKDAITVASTDHQLRIDFVGSTGASPTVSPGSRNKVNEVQPLEKVTYSNLWQGIDLAYSTVDDGIAESIWRIAPEGNPGNIILK